jgi:hypothetical protein
MLLWLGDSEFLLQDNGDEDYDLINTITSGGAGGEGTAACTFKGEDYRYKCARHAF